MAKGYGDVGLSGIGLAPESTDDAFKRWRTTMETLVAEMETNLLKAVDDKGLTIHCYNSTNSLLTKFVGTYTEVEQAIKEGV